MGSTKISVTQLDWCKIVGLQVITEWTSKLYNTSTQSGLNYLIHLTVGSNEVTNVYPLSVAEEVE